MKKCFKLSNGQLGPYPEGRNVAAKLSSRLYTNLNKCETCGKSQTFITASGRCAPCMRNQIAAVYMFISMPEGIQSHQSTSNLPDNFTPMGEAHEAVKLLKSDQGFELGREVCTEYGHIKLTNDKYHKCYFCETQRNKQEQAEHYGDEHYLTRSKCSGCDSTTLRNTTDRSCVDCGYTPRTRQGVVSATALMMRNNPDMVISREDARSLDMTVYRTGEPCSRGHTSWRYVSTGNCIPCMKGEE